MGNTGMTVRLAKVGMMALRLLATRHVHIRQCKSNGSDRE